VARRAWRRRDVGRAKGTDVETVHQQAASLPTGRFTTPEEVATLVTLLASPRTANVTGSNYIIDGGLVKTM
jgi:NAD(P)-dependent dehydrogenase (short-subunit alcohol dehydrogenase family)